MNDDSGLEDSVPPSNLRRAPGILKPGSLAVEDKSAFAMAVAQHTATGLDGAQLKRPEEVGDGIEDATVASLGDGCCSSTEKVGGNAIDDAGDGPAFSERGENAAGNTDRFRWRAASAPPWTGPRRSFACQQRRLRGWPRGGALGKHFSALPLGSRLRAAGGDGSGAEHRAFCLLWKGASSVSIDAPKSAEGSAASMEKKTALVSLRVSLYDATTGNFFGAPAETSPRECEILDGRAALPVR